MTNKKKELFFTYGPLVLAIFAWVMICIWYVGCILAIGSIGLGIYYNRQYGKNKFVTASYVISGSYIGIALLVLLFWGIYMAILPLHR